MCLAVSTAVAIAFLFTVVIRALYQGGKITKLDWDVTTITAGDYSVEFKIDKSSYKDWWIKEKYECAGGWKEKGESRAHAFKLDMIENIEGPLTKWCELNPYYNLDGKDEKPEEFPSLSLKKTKSQM